MNLTIEERQKLEQLLEPGELTQIIRELYPDLQPATHRVMSSNWRKGKGNNRKIQEAVIKRAKIQQRLNNQLKEILA